MRPALESKTNYISMDYPSTSGAYSGRPDVYGTALNIPVKDNSLDCVLLLDVAEHLLDADKAIDEIRRILKPGGECFVHIPFLYPLHDEPNDYTRWTKHGIAQMAFRNNMRLIEIRSLGSPSETATGLFAMAIAAGVISENKFFRKILSLLTLGLIPFINLIGWSFAHLYGDSEIMPTSYEFILKK